MKTESIKASDFKARCLALLDEVAEGHAEFVVTKHGREVARVVPVSTAPSTFGSVTLVAEEESSYFGVGETWDADN
ncbi:type II toxin-antitoxin system Phd/YefM family antitoxin [soil metagenome]